MVRLSRGYPPNTDKIRELLREGDLRSIGRVPEVIELAQNTPGLFGLLVEALADPDPGVRMRASDAVEKISRGHPEYLQPHKVFLLRQAGSQTQQEVRWHLAQILPRLQLTARERLQTSQLLFSYLESPSRIVQTNALQALFDLTQNDRRLLQPVGDALEKLVKTGSPAVRNRAQKLLHLLVR
jgi:HEAT repeat protein